MRKHRYTALVIFLLALPSFGQFTEIWTNGDYFAVEQMASQCYSASVERCVAAGVVPDSPSWYDYLVGKNHAKLVSVKNNIKNCRAYYLRNVADPAATLDASGPAGLKFADDAAFLSYCGLPSDTLTENPYFKTQYTNTVGGWHAAWRMLTNQVATFDNARLGIETDGFTEYTVTFFGGDYGGQASISSLSNSAAASIYEDPVLRDVWYDYFVGSTVPGSYSVVMRMSGTSDYLGYFFSAPVWVGYTNKNTTISRSAQAFSKCSAPYTFYDYSADVTAFYANGDTVANGWALSGSIPESMAASNSVKVGTGYIGTNPTIPAFNQSVPLDDTWYGSGWQIADQFVILKWTTSINGFKYR